MKLYLKGRGNIDQMTENGAKVLTSMLNVQFKIIFKKNLIKTDHY